MRGIIRIDKFLANMSVGTRKQVREIIKSGRVKISGVTVTDYSLKFDSRNHIVEVCGEATDYSDYEYYMLNKPAGVVSATKDENDKTVLDLITSKKRKDLFPVGRLDKDTEGLLIITNDGELCHELLSPKKHVDKTYYVESDIYIDEAMAEKLENGVDIGEKNLTMKACVKVESAGEKNVSYITIREGKYHQIKRMYNAVGANVTYLKRISMGGLELDKNLKSGEYRLLTDKEVQLLKRNK